MQSVYNLHATTIRIYGLGGLRVLSQEVSYCLGTKHFKFKTKFWNVTESNIKGRGLDQNQLKLEWFLEQL